MLLNVAPRHHFIQDEGYTHCRVIRKLNYQSSPVVVVAANGIAKVFSVTLNQSRPDQRGGPGPRAKVIVQSEIPIIK